MGRVIADIYEILDQIGAGGGGVVYLGRHLRLDKQIVLKADRRTLNTDANVLRREVNMLKELSHTYIPQVYDFVQEDGVVYTIMDFIEGESLDQLLKRGQIPSQPQVIKWACQLLEALEYLHSRPPYGILHGDIKPANVMLRPSGDICLIDYNIALALGEDGAIRAGFSRGYASPEHYGIEFGSRTHTETNKHTEKIERTQLLGDAELAETEVLPSNPEEKEFLDSRQKVSGVLGGQIHPSEGSGTSGVMLDARSDVYSLGATLYHLLSGKRPEQNAAEVKVLGPDSCSPAVSKIIAKSMAPDPKMRYQTAKEMLTAFRQLHTQDLRVIRHKRRMVFSAALLSVIFLSGGGSAFVGMKRLEQTQQALALAEYSANDLAEGNISGAVSQALKAIPTKKSIFQAPATAQSQKALTDALGVYDLSDGFHALDTVQLPSAPFTVTFSPDGSRFAVVYQHELAVFDTDTGDQLEVLPALNSALSDVIFADNDKILFAGEQGVTAYDLVQKKVLWTGEEATTLSLSGDGTKAAAVNRDADYGVIYNISDGTKAADCSFQGHHMTVAANDIFANPGNRIFALNGDGSLLAVSFSQGELLIFDIEDPDNSIIVYEESDYRNFGGGFCGNYFAFAANKSDSSLFGLIDAAEGVYIGAMDSRDEFILKASEKGIYLANQNTLVRFDPDTLEEIEMAYTDDKYITGFSVSDSYTVATTDDNSFSLFDKEANWMSSEMGQEPWDFTDTAGGYVLAANRNEPSVRLLKLESHKDTEIWLYDSHYLHDEARISQDGQTAMLFDYEGFRIYDREGNMLAEVLMPEARYIYDQQFRRREDGSWLEVTWYDGTVRCYSAADGSLISETAEEPPSADLYEEFLTDRYRIASPLHGTPQVYDKESGKLVTELEKDSYLTYVTQLDEYVVTEYISAAGQKYGLLLNDKLETLAYLPDLCDIVDGNLIFDYGYGNLRQCRLYSLQELVALGETYLKNEKGGVQ